MGGLTIIIIVITLCNKDSLIFLFVVFVFAVQIP